MCLHRSPRHSPFRADHVGSLLRPQRLFDARERFAAGAIAADELRSVEDDAIRDVVALQEEVGLQSAADGEFRRVSWHMDFIYRLDGISKAQDNLKVEFRNAEGTIEFTPASLKVDGRVGLGGPIVGDDFRFLAETVTKNTPKLTVPSPSTGHAAGRPRWSSPPATTPRPHPTTAASSRRRFAGRARRSWRKAGASWRPSDQSRWRSCCERGAREGHEGAPGGPRRRAVDAANERTTDFTRDFQDPITRYAWGEIWTRSGLDRRTRSAITMTALVTLGRCDELRMHVRAARRNGMSGDEIMKVLLQCAIYAGVPAATAFKVAQEVLEEDDSRG